MIFEKQRHIIDFTISSLLRKRGKIMALLAAYTLVIFSLASVMFFVHSIKKEASIVLRNAPDMIVQSFVAGRQSSVPQSHIDSIRRMEGVQSVKPRLWGYYYDALSGANFTVMVNESLKERAGEIIIGNGVRWRNTSINRNLATRKNDSIPFKTYGGSVQLLKVKGILSSTSDLLTSDLVLISEEDFKKVFSLPDGHATDLLLQVDSAKLPSLATRISETHPDVRAVSREEILNTYDAIFDWKGGLFFVITAGALFAFLILLWDKAMGLSEEEKAEIGILKAIGWETSDILLMKLWEGAAVSITAFIMGILAAYLHIFLAAFVLFEPVLKGWSVLYPDLRLTPFINPGQMISLLFLTVAPYTAATVIPSWRCATSALE